MFISLFHRIVKGFKQGDEIKEFLFSLPRFARNEVCCIIPSMCTLFTKYFFTFRPHQFIFLFLGFFPEKNGPNNRKNK